MNLQPQIKFSVRLGQNFLLFIFLFLSVSCSNSNIEQKSDAQVSNTQPLQNESGMKAANLSKLYEDKNCKEFINAFPNTFQEFDQLYGFDDEKGARVLFSKSDVHVSYFFNCAEVSEHEKLEKVIKIGIDGKWEEADSIYMLQDSIYDLIKKNSNKTKELLGSLPDEKAASFWYFLFDAPHPTDKENAKRIELMKKVLGKESRQSKLLSEQYEKLKIDWKNH